MAPMNPRLLRPIAARGGAGFDVDAAAYIAAVETADTQPLELAVKTAINDFIVGCKADGIWNAIKISGILMGARTLSGALTPLKGGSVSNVSNNFVSGDYDRKNGLTGGGPGSGKYLTQVIPSATYTNNNSFSTFITIRAGGGNNWGCADNGNRYGFFGANTAVPNFRCASGTQFTHGTVKTVGLLGAARSVSSEFVCRNAGVTETKINASAVNAETPFYVFSATGGTFSVADTQAFYHFGEYLDLALLDSRVSALHAAIGAAIP